MTTSWTIEHNGLAVEVELAAEQLRWRAVHDAIPGGTLLASPIADIKVNGVAVRWTRALGVEQGTGKSGAPNLTVTVEDDGGQLQAAVTFELFADHPFVRVGGQLTRTSAQGAPVVDGAAILHLGLVKDVPLTFFHVEQFSWAYPTNFFAQRQVPLVQGLTPTEVRMGSFPSHYHGDSSCAWAAIRTGGPDRRGETPQPGQGIVLGIEFNGKSRVKAWAVPGEAHVESTIDDLYHPLGMGEHFELPPFFVGVFAGDWDEAGYVTQRFAEHYVYPPIPDQNYPWAQYNSWRYGQDINEAQQLVALERCAELGLEVMVLDLGWARMIGDWRPDPVKFPRGLAPIAERARQLGIKFGVHMALAQMHPDAPAAKAHPDWLIHTGDDYFGAGPICLANDPCREWLIEQIVRLVREEKLDYIIQDGEDMVKRCTRTDHTHHPADSNYSGSINGIDRVVAEVRAAHPHLVFENCEDGGCMMTFKMARTYHTSITVDNIATYATRQGIYGASYPFSARYSVRYMQDDPTPYTLRSAIFGGPLIHMQRITEWTPEEMAATQRAIGEYKRLRGLIRDGKIIHLLPPATNVESLGRGWDAIQAVSADQAQSVVMVYRAKGGVGQETIKPRGLRADAAYRVHYVDAGREVVSTGEEIQRDGLAVTLDELSSEILELALA
jgi:alpha-galactosidase